MHPVRKGSKGGVRFWILDEVASSTRRLGLLEARVRVVEQLFPLRLPISAPGKMFICALASL
jgi:hypothetical protein